MELRPLAHVSLRDQVVTTAIMLCLADLVETLQGDPRPNGYSRPFQPTVSYGNRLFCDVSTEGLHEHRWGSSKLYRGFSQDYKTFVERPDHVAASLPVPADHRLVVIQSDLSQFYDRVRPGLLHSKLATLLGPQADPAFLQLARQVFDWRWSEQDVGWVRRYAREKDIEGFEAICLPQGLVSSGFFANVVMLDFDQRLLGDSGSSIGSGIVLEDTSRYVDDLRLVATAPIALPLAEIEQFVFDHLTSALSATAPGLEPSRKKTRAANIGGEVRPLLRQSRKMARIQQSISGGFDVARGQEVIDAVQSLIRAQEHYSREDADNQTRATRNGRDKRLPVPDVKDATVARFAAARFRATYRSLRPLLIDPNGEDAELLSQMEAPIPYSLDQPTKVDLDEEARNFALNLVQSCIENPSNVRLLRIGLDIWPSVQELGDVLKLLRPYLTKADSPARRVALYCLSEVFKAGATETGFVKDVESLSPKLDLDAFRTLLSKEAVFVLERGRSIPWYLLQQAFLVVAAFRTKLPDRTTRRLLSSSEGGDIERHVRFIRFLNGDFTKLSAEDFASFAVMARRSMLNKDEAVSLVSYELDDEILREVRRRDPGFASELSQPKQKQDRAPATGMPKGEKWIRLSDAVDPASGVDLRHEVGIASLFATLAEHKATKKLPEALLPWHIELRTRKSLGHDRITEIRVNDFVPMDDDPLAALYAPPNWCPAAEQWRFQFGYLARFILTGNLDFTVVPRASWRENHPVYRPVQSHWYQRTYGLHSGLEGFGDDWLAISEDTEEILYTLLAWPGCRERDDGWVRMAPRDLITFFRYHLAAARKRIGKGTETLMLRVAAPLFQDPSERPLKGCVVQTIMPHEFDPLDLTKSDPAFRKRHRLHLTTALAAVEKMMDLRATHEEVDKRLDWLILPELAVHPDDVNRYLLPFARRYKAMILAGLTYQHLHPGLPAVNSAMWLLPQLVPGRGLQMKKRRQGKAHLAAKEVEWEALGLVRSFRPCQWLVGYEWDKRGDERPLWLSAAVCYDSTDLSLASDLRKLSDVFAIPALNKDVGTFDQMAIALHYHMYQLVIVANNGRYGGSNAHVPKKERHIKQVFHSHGQPQASISFFEINDIRDMINRRQSGLAPTKGVHPDNVWKYPPANF
ncbi:RNA-directed DNA polymerase [Rhizobium bangladeshense]|uniref:RNA-directed DNA polymerase n=2 Tax=Rhizobium bangladeshense TaxID=1138189 RepID=A0ABS7LFT4_9HYPH|nr:RNA-directed DNA polymerase [Rhizobium bangladeshense]MBY3590280.1 RNA-directed DNA polymerase [Rhizobium bangladeshense]